MIYKIWDNNWQEYRFVELFQEGVDLGNGNFTCAAFIEIGGKEDSLRPIIREDEYNKIIRKLEADTMDELKRKYPEEFI